MIPSIDKINWKAFSFAFLVELVFTTIVYGWLNIHDQIDLGILTKIAIDFIILIGLYHLFNWLLIRKRANT